MKTQSYSKRIALNFMAATAVLVAVIFSSIYLVVYQTVFNHLNQDLRAEYHEVARGIAMIDGRLTYTNPEEWEENEHGQVEVNPIFIQLANSSGQVIRRSPNLMGISMEFVKNAPPEVIFNTNISSGHVRQLQKVLLNDQHQLIGYISVAVPLQESTMVLDNLLLTLLIAFPFAILVLYFITKYMAERSMQPVKFLTESAEKITRENLNERIELPGIKDELYILTDTINSLLDRIEDTLLREKQFSSDASHELRTPLSVLKGTLELMVRKPRDPGYYKDKSVTCLEEVNRMSVLVDQLLLLARYENTEEKGKQSDVDLSEIMDQLIARHATSIENREISLDLKIGNDATIYSNRFMVEQILENIFANAIKYSNPKGNIEVHLKVTEKQKSLIIRDEGVGMNPKELSGIFNRFYRADESRNSQVKGYGLGLAIAKRFADQLDIWIDVESEVEKGTTFTLTFPTDQKN